MFFPPKFWRSKVLRFFEFALLTKEEGGPTFLQIHYDMSYISWLSYCSPLFYAISLFFFHASLDILFLKVAMRLTNYPPHNSGSVLGSSLSALMIEDIASDTGAHHFDS